MVPKTVEAQSFGSKGIRSPRDSMCVAKNLPINHQVPQKRELKAMVLSSPLVAPGGCWWWPHLQLLMNHTQQPSCALFCKEKSPIYENKKKPCSSCTFSFFILLPLTRPPYYLRATKLFLMKFSFFVFLSSWLLPFSFACAAFLHVFFFLVGSKPFFYKFLV